MRIKVKILGVVQTNCYILLNDNKGEALIIDPADHAKNIKKELDLEKIRPVAILLTHGHFDHILAATELSELFEIPIYASEFEKQLLMDGEMNGSKLINQNIIVTQDHFVQDGQHLNLGGMNIEAIHTPGHTSGGICYYFPDESVVFSGDTLFFESIGRTDFATGNYEELISSIKEKLFTLPENVKVYPGHGEETTIGHEKSKNPFFKTI